ncbi:MAG: hypothetical protein M3Y59_16040 [Myxococcota bacterium]|nr:hypothetical protein [Myxococcota bacterium]
MRTLLLTMLVLTSFGCLDFPGALSRCEDAGRCDAPAALQFGQPTAVFARQDAGTLSAIQQLTLSNPGIVASGPITLQVTGPQASEFQVEDTTCAAALDPGASCQVELRFAPQGPAVRTATLEATANPGGGAVATLSGVAPDPVTLTLWVVGDGGGMVIVGSDGTCNQQCAFPFERGTQVALSAEPSGGSRFVEYSGGCSGSDTFCGPTLEADTTVMANFEVLTYRLELQLLKRADAGSALVTSVPPGISCPGTCTANYLPGTVVTLTASAAEPDLLVAWDGGACGGPFPVCRVEMTADQTPSALFDVRTLPANYAFITSTTVAPGAVGGLAGADAFCQSRAAAAGLPGTFRAWVSSDVGPVHAVDRLGTAEGWRRPDGEVVTLSKSDLAGQRHLYPLTLDEFGQPLPTFSLVATGTDNEGKANSGRNCGGFTTTAGDVFSKYSDMTWGAGTGSTCAQAQHLYCFGIDSTLPPGYIPLQGRKAFISSSNLSGHTGLAAADAFCQADAVAAGLTGAFRAMLSTSTQSAESRFDSGRAAWVRVDGVGLSHSASGMFSQDPFRAAFNLTAAGDPVGCYGTWTGSSQPNLAGTASSTCDDWISNDTQTGMTGIACGLSREQVWGRTPSACNSTINRLYCLER